MLPERINAMRVVTYYVPDIVTSLKEMNDDPNFEPDIDEVMEYIEDWVYNDMADPNWGLTYQDENGEEL